ncbi:RIP metalloprotease RseP [Caulobacter sp. Root655]|uniref:RIP metalloprotease RseP n=1 Tax=Caulobacter sp. Root655 TaxID=1736578 RepID=UPI0006FB1964|nr:RIP metalloprotease RseP [Caulobacter sp. Root655]KRA65126.1 RIP metalloprotease RseP [Caulobacter sp. Root655]
MLGFMQSAATYLIAFPLVILLVVTVHELGHFWAAKACGVAIDRFSIGFGKPIAKWRDKAGVQWQLGWLPLGGYVRFSGDENVASVPDQDDLKSLRAQIEHIEGKDAVARYFHFKPLWQRAFVVVAGPAANFILAIVLFAVLAGSFGETMRRPIVSGLVAGSPAAAAGFRQGDVILSANGRKLKNFEDLDRYVMLRSDVPIHFEVRRGGEDLNIDATPVLKDISDGLGNSQKGGVLGFGLPAVVGNVMPGSAADRAGFKPGDVITTADETAIGSFEDLTAYVKHRGAQSIRFNVYRDKQYVPLEATPAMGDAMGAQGKMERRLLLGVGPALPSTYVAKVRYNPVQALGVGVTRTWDVLDTTVYYLGRMIRGQVSADQIGGPLGIAKTSGQVAQAGAANGGTSLPMMLLGAGVALLSLAAFLSVSVGFMNLLPIPVLDGGHLLFYAYEAVAQRPLGARLQAAGYRVGLALLLGFMLFATWNDLQRLSVFKFFGGLFS